MNHVRPRLRSRVNFRHLQCFLEVARSGSLTKAGAVLALTQPAVSKTLHELEEDLGVRLLDRNKAGVELTDDGRNFHRYASISVSALRSGLDALSQSGAGKLSPLRTGCSLSSAASIMPDILLEFGAAFPDIPLEVVSGPIGILIPKLKHGELELLIGRMPEGAHIAGLNFEPLFQENGAFAVRVGHPLCGENFSPKQIADYPLIVPRDNGVIWRDISNFFISLGVMNLRPHLMTNCPDLAKSYLQSTDAVWCVRRGVVAADVVENRLALLPVDTGTLSSTIGITTIRDLPLSTVARIFLDIVRNHPPEKAANPTHPKAAA